MFCHLAKTTAPSNVVISTSDTDCLIISLGCYQFLDKSLKIWIEAGTSNTHRNVNVNQIHSALCKALPAYHACTGCDYNCSFNRKVKVRPLKLLPSAIVSGWKEKNDCYRLHWFDGETSPALSDGICNEVDHSQECHGEDNNTTCMIIKRYLSLKV